VHTTNAAGTTSLALTHWRIRLGVEDATDTSLDITTGAEVPTTSPVPLTVVKNAGPSVAAVGRCASDLDDAVRAAVSQRQVTDTEVGGYVRVYGYGARPPSTVNAMF